MTRQTDWEYLRPLLLEAIGDTLYMVGVAIAVAAVLGTAMGIGLYVTRRGGLFASRAAYTVLNLLVNLVRPTRSSSSSRRSGP